MLTLIVASFIFPNIWANQLSGSGPKQAVTGKIQGVLLDINDARIVAATVIVENAYFKRELKSGDEDDFEVQVPAGTYQIRVQANGFRKFELSPFKVRANTTEMINIHLDVAVISDPY